MKKNQIKTLCILAALIVVLSATLVFLSYEPEAEVLPPLVSLAPEDVTSLSYTTLTADMDFVRTGDGWQLENDPNFPVNSALVDAMVQTLCSAYPQAVMEESDPEAFGLTQPQCTIEAVSASGVTTVLIGSMNAVTDQLYVQVGHQVYLTDTTLLQAFNGSALDLAAQYTIPKPDDQQRVQIQNTNGTVLLSCVGSETGGADGIWYVQVDDAFVEADQTMAYNFYFLTWDLHWQSTAGYVTDESQLADYGLDTPQARYTLIYGGNTFDMLLGTDLPDGTTYAMCAGDNLVYTIDSVMVQWLNQATAQLVLPAESQTNS